MNTKRCVVNLKCVFMVFFAIFIQTVYGFNSTFSQGSNVNAISCIQPNGINNETVIFLGNCENLLYFANLPFGSNKQVLTWQIATGISISWMPLVEANQTNGFNFSGSTTVNVTNTTGYIQFGNDSAVGGNFGSDYIEISADSNVDSNIDILFIFNQTGPQVPQGVEGAISLDYAGQNMFDIAFENKKIITSIFCLDLNPSGQQSYLYYNNGLPFQISQNTTWIPRYSQVLNSWWEVEIIDMEINGIQLTQNVPTTATLNTGSSFVNFGPDLFNSIVDQYFNFTYCFIDNGFPVCPCNLSSSWPSFSFKLMGVEVYLQPAQYKKEFSSTGLCSAGIVSGISDNNQIVLGLPFFKGYTVSFNKLQTNIGFYGNSKPVYIYDLNNPFSSYFIISQYVICGVTGLFSIYGLIFSILNCLKMRSGKTIQKYVKKFEKNEKLMDQSISDDKSSQKNQRRPSFIEMNHKIEQTVK